MKERLHFEDNTEGWLLEIRQFWDPERLEPSRNPIVMIPGYGMNTFILNYHPRGTSMVAYLVARGFEVWTANLRGQGGSRRVGGDRSFGFAELSLVDVPRVIDFVRANTRTKTPKVDAVGCSLGATFLYAYLAHHPADVIQNLVAVGGPLRWDEVHPLVKVAFHSPALVGAIPMFGTRELARRVLPIAKRVPKLLSVYMNSELVDLSAAEMLVQTVDDPVPRLNKQIAHWINAKDLVVRGVNVTEALRGRELRTLAILANADGVVPEGTARSIEGVLSPVEVLRVGDPKNWFAHADLFISDQAQARVFEPLARWLERET